MFAGKSRRANLGQNQSDERLSDVSEYTQITVEEFEDKMLRLLGPPHDDSVVIMGLLTTKQLIEFWHHVPADSLPEPDVILDAGNQP